jgi:hypothetical protein
MWTTHSNRKVGKRTAYVFIAKGLIWNKYGCRQANLSRKLAVWHIVHDFFRGRGGSEKVSQKLHEIRRAHTGVRRNSHVTCQPKVATLLHVSFTYSGLPPFARYATSRLQCWRTPPLVTPANSPGVRGLAGVWWSWYVICFCLTKQEHANFVNTPQVPVEIFLKGAGILYAKSDTVILHGRLIK